MVAALESPKGPSPTEYRLIGPSEDGQISNLLDGLSDKEARHRLQALISEWLRMENLVVLTGAGSSVSSGGKTMANLEKSVLDALRAAASVPQSVRSILASRAAEELLGSVDRTVGFEEWLSFLVNAAYLASDGGSPLQGVTWKGGSAVSAADFAWLIERASRAIFAECALSLPEPVPAADASTLPPPHLSFLAKLVARDSNLGRAHLFTLNYDTLFEQALERLGIQYFDGFTGRAEARFDPSVYGLDIYYPGEVAEGRVRRFDKFLHFYKLHGSIHWQIREGEVRARHPDLQQFATYRGLAASAKAELLEALSGKMLPIGILPTANKFSQTLSMPFAHLFRSLQIRLTAPQTFLLVLGYGFGDEHVTRIIETALMNPSLVMLVVEPNPKSGTIARIQQYKELGKRAFVLTPTDAAFELQPFKIATFDDFARTVMPDVQWLDDFLRLRRFERQIQSSADTRGTGPQGDDEAWLNS